MLFNEFLKKALCYYVINAIFDSKRGPNVINFSIFHPILTQFFLQNDHLIELLVGHSNILVCYFWKGSKSTRILKCSAYLKGISNFYFSSNFIFFKFIELRASYSMSMDFLYLYPVSEINSTEKTKAEFQNLNFLIFYPILMQIFAKWSSLWVIDGPLKKLLFYF